MSEDWLTNSEAQTIVSVARRLCDQYSNARFFSLGQSPAWIVEAIALDAEAKGRYVETGLIPFSSGFLLRTAISFSGTKAVFLLEDSYLPASLKNPSITNAYREVLKRIGADSQTIIRKYKEKGTRTTLIDFAWTAQSMASFLFFLFEEAKEKGCLRELKQSLAIHLFRKDKKKGAQGVLTLPPESEKIGFWIETFPNSWLLNKLWTNDEDKRTRIVPRYPPQRWKAIPYPPQAEGEEGLVLRTYNRLKAIIKDQALS